MPPKVSNSTLSTSLDVKKTSSPCPELHSIAANSKKNAASCTSLSRGQKTISSSLVLPAGCDDDRLNTILHPDLSMSFQKIFSHPMISQAMQAQVSLTPLPSPKATKSPTRSSGLATLLNYEEIVPSSTSTMRSTASEK